MDDGEITLSTLREQVDEARKRIADSPNRKPRRPVLTYEIDVRHFP